MPALRPIQRERWNSDAVAAVGLAIHSVLGHGAVPQKHPGLLVTSPELAGFKVRDNLGGGYFNPPRAQRSANDAQTTTAPGTPTT